jgi:hypothetical protein
VGGMANARVALCGRGRQPLRLAPTAFLTPLPGPRGPFAGEDSASLWTLLPGPLEATIFNALTPYSTSYPTPCLPVSHMARTLAFVLCSPIYLLMRGTIPVVDPEHFSPGWLLLSALLMPLGCLFYISDMAGFWGFGVCGGRGAAPVEAVVVVVVVVVEVL